MGFSIEHFSALRPTLWHLTHRDNLALIRKSRILLPADQLTSIPAGPRRSAQMSPGIPVLRDQELLHEKCISFEPGFSMADLICELNRRVFFWSGGPNRPIKAGRNAIDHYRMSDCLIRLPFLDVARNQVPYFSRCNSGAPRMQHGKPVPRGPHTFLEAVHCDFSPSKAVEVTFLQPVTLPSGTEAAQCLEGPWELL